MAIDRSAVRDHHHQRETCFGVDASRTNRLSCAPVFLHLFVFFVEIFVIIITLAILATIEPRDKLIQVSVGGLVLQGG